jgi:RecA-family ATPase
MPFANVTHVPIAELLGENPTRAKPLLVENVAGVARVARVPARLAVRRASEIEAKLLTWLWPGRIPYGKLTVFEGDAGLGKSLVTATIAAAVTRGRPLPDGTPTDPADVIIVNLEDAPDDTTKPRLHVAGADMARVHNVDGMPDEEGSVRPLTIPDDLPALEVLIRETAARLVVVDPLMATLSERTDSYKDQSVRRALAPFAKIAEATGVAVLVVRHLKKGASGRAMANGGGSVAFGAAARSVLTVGEHPDDPTRRVLAQVKTNLAKLAPSLVYTVEEVAAVVDGIRFDSLPQVAWRGQSELSANDLASARAEQDHAEQHSGTATDEAAAFLREWLSNGPLAKPEVLKLAAKERISERTLQRAARTIGVQMHRAAFGKDHHTQWMLPTHATPATRAMYHSNRNVARVAEGEADAERCPWDNPGPKEAA